MHPYNQQKEIREFAKKHNIAVTGFSSLGSRGLPSSMKSSHFLSLPTLLKHPVIEKIAKKHKKSSAQILLRFSHQLDVIVLPKSVHPERVKENIHIFDFKLSENDMKEIEDLDLGEKGRYLNFLYIKG